MRTHLIRNIRAMLLADAAFVAAIGSGNNLYIDEQTQGSIYPAVILSIVDTVGTESLAGVVAPWRSRVSVDCRSGDPTTTHNVGERVMDALNNRGNEVVGDKLIHECRNVGDIPIRDPVSDVFRRVLDFRVQYTPV